MSFPKFNRLFQLFYYFTHLVFVPFITEILCKYLTRAPVAWSFFLHCGISIDGKCDWFSVVRDWAGGSELWMFLGIPPPPRVSCWPAGFWFAYICMVWKRRVFDLNFWNLPFWHLDVLSLPGSAPSPLRSDSFRAVQVVKSFKLSLKGGRDADW